MKVVLLCGGQGTRIRDVSEVLPKPMLPIGNMPIIWHIMKAYSFCGFNDFVLCLGYKGWLIKEFFLNYAAKTCDLKLDLSSGNVTYYGQTREKEWKITLVETGEKSQTGARIWNAREYLKGCGTFSVTYGDGVSDVNISAVLKTHKASKMKGTVSGVHPSGRFGELEVSGNRIKEFNEKPNVGKGMINGGFMFFEESALEKYFQGGSNLILEKDVLPKMVRDNQLGVYRHKGFWQCVDTSREYILLNEMWRNNKAPWKTWGTK